MEIHPLATEVVKSVCGLCAGNCGVLITLEGGKPIAIEGDPESPINRGGLCRIGRASLEYLNHPDRLKTPLKRVGERGEGKWKQISWDDAYAYTADRLNEVKRINGPGGVVMAHGSAKGPIDTHLVRLANAFGTPNVVCADHVCHVPKMLAAELTFGFMPGAEYGHPSACIIVWGSNPAATRCNVFSGLAEAVKRGAKVISIDPLQTGIAKRADIWLQLRPGTDLALALSMLNTIINEELYDKDFVSRWTVGFEKLREHVQDYTPDKVAEITWVPSELIVKAARLYASHRPGHIEWGNAIDHQVDSFQAARAISMLMAVTGNLGVPGGEQETLGSGFREDDPDKASSQIGLRGRWSFELELRPNLSTEDRKKKITPGLLPDFRYVLPQSVLRAILEEDPYPIRAMFVMASNPLSCWPNLHRTFSAFKKLDFLAVSDMFMTPTAAMADIVFPAATYLESDGIQMPPMGTIAQMQRKVAQTGECRSDHEIINDLAKKLGLGALFWKSVDDFWNAMLEPTGLTFDVFKRLGRFAGAEKPKQYKKYESEGFKTPSGKVEFFSERLQSLGFDPLPIYREPPESPCGNPELAEEYPLLCTTWKLSVYRHSGGRQIPSLRSLHPDPLVLIHPETARRNDIRQGDWVFIQTKRGRIRQKARISEAVDPRVVVADHAWWYPERNEKDLFGFKEANFNVLTDDGTPFNKEVGSFSIRGIACRIYRAPFDKG
ncbi:MAG: molybdopterin-dependent oxidoreductase [Thermodesulfobacteriota bacterium]